MKFIGIRILTPLFGDRTPITTQVYESEDGLYWEELRPEAQHIWQDIQGIREVDGKKFMYTNMDLTQSSNFRREFISVEDTPTKGDFIKYIILIEVYNWLLGKNISDSAMEKFHDELLEPAKEKSLQYIKNLKS